MAAKISEELSRQLKEAEREASPKEMPVIISFNTEADLAALKEKGLKIQHAYENINAVAGTLPAAAVHEVAQLDEVEQIDYDGQAFALPKEGGAQ